MKKKWIFYGVMALALAGGFAACNDDDDKDKKHETEQTEQTDTDDGKADDPTDGKTEGESGDDDNGTDNTPEETTGVMGGHEWVDLGLPSGVKWATMNIGAESPEDYGYYFAWGETVPKEEYSRSTYFNGEIVSRDDYGTNKDLLRNITKISGKYDAASSNWGGKWRMPTYDEIKELLSRCKGYELTTLNGKVGYKIIGRNGNSIFLPAAGYREYTKLYYEGSGAHYWSSSRVEPESDDVPLNAWRINFGSGKGYSPFNWGLAERYYGLSVRAVWK